MLDKLTALNMRLANMLLWLGGLGLVGMTLIVGWQVFARYVLNDSPSWSEQLTLLMMLWYALLAAAAGFQHGFHIKIIAAQISMGEGVARILRIIVEALLVMMGVVFMIWGFQIAEIFATHSIPALGVSRFWAYLPIPVSGGFITLFCTIRLWGEITVPGWTQAPIDGDGAAAIAKDS